MGGAEKSGVRGASPEGKDSGCWVLALRFWKQPRVRFNLLFDDYGEAEHALYALVPHHPPLGHCTEARIYWRA